MFLLFRLKSLFCGPLSTSSSWKLIGDLLAHYWIIWIRLISRTKSIRHPKTLKNILACNLGLYIFSIKTVWKLMDVVIRWVEAESICMRFWSQRADVDTLIIWESAGCIIPIIFTGGILVRSWLVFLRVQTFICFCSIWSFVTIIELLWRILSLNNEFLVFCNKVDLRSLSIKCTTTSGLPIEWIAGKRVHINTTKSQTRMMILMHLTLTHNIILTVLSVTRWVRLYLWNLLFLMVILLCYFTFRKASFSHSTTIFNMLG